jgi:hypothetical protein
MRARTLNDLVVQSDERQVLWRSLRERVQSYQVQKADLPEADLPPELLMALLGIKELQGSYKVKENKHGDID